MAQSRTPQTKAKKSPATASKSAPTNAKATSAKVRAVKTAVKSQKASTKAAAAQSRAPSADHKHPHTRALLELRAFGLSYPETHLKSPWPEHLDLAVRDKTFVYLSLEGEPLHLSCKLPQSCQAALDLEFTEPTGYGLGKSGWVTATFKDSDEPPVEFLKTWIDESYRAQAPKSLTKTLPKMT